MSEHYNDETELMRAKSKDDIMTMMLTNGKERSGRDWQEIVTNAGFSRCEITATVGIRSIMEVFP